MKKEHDIFILIMKLSIIVPATREKKYLTNLINSIENANKPVYFSIIEFIVVGEQQYNLKTNDNNIIIKELLTTEKHPNIKRNIGVKNSLGDLIAIIDDDIIVAKSWLYAIYNEYVVNQYNGLLTGPSNLLYSKDFSQRVSNYIFSSILYSFRTTTINEKYKEVRFNGVSFCNLIITRKIWTTVGPICENSDFRVDDKLYCYRIVKTGFSLLNCPDLKVAHKRRGFPFYFFINEAIVMLCIVFKVSSRMIINPCLK